MYRGIQRLLVVVSINACFVLIFYHASVSYVQPAEIKVLGEVRIRSLESEALSTLPPFDTKRGTSAAPLVYNPTSLRFESVAREQAATALPSRLIIPTLSIDATIQYVGATSEGVMEVPTNTVDVGWFDIGPRPGESGNAVIAGHFDGERGEAGVFTNLHELKPGDLVYVEDSNDASIAFIVRESRIYTPGYVNEVFSPSDSAHLNLITCAGSWNEDKKTYTERLVVFADIAY